MRTADRRRRARDHAEGEGARRGGGRGQGLAEDDDDGAAVDRGHGALGRRAHAVHVVARLAALVGVVEVGVSPAAGLDRAAVELQLVRGDVDPVVVEVARLDRIGEQQRLVAAGVVRPLQMLVFAAADPQLDARRARDRDRLVEGHRDLDRVADGVGVVVARFGGDVDAADGRGRGGLAGDPEHRGEAVEGLGVGIPENKTGTQGAVARGGGVRPPEPHRAGAKRFRCALKERLGAVVVAAG